MAVAYCFRSGQIRVTERKGEGAVPVGALPIASGSRHRLRNAIDGNARLAYDNRTRLVPGIPEAADDGAALEALFRFRDRIQKSLER